MGQTPIPCRSTPASLPSRRQLGHNRGRSEVSPAGARRMKVLAAIYARKSTDQLGLSDEQKSVVRQVEHARAYAARKGWTVLDEYVFVDDAVSGAEFATRPGFVRLRLGRANRRDHQGL